MEELTYADLLKFTDAVIDAKFQKYFVTEFGKRIIQNVIKRFLVSNTEENRGTYPNRIAVSFGKNREKGVLLDKTNMNTFFAAVIKEFDEWRRQEYSIINVTLCFDQMKGVHCYKSPAGKFYYDHEDMPVFDLDEFLKVSKLIEPYKK